MGKRKTTPVAALSFEASQYEDLFITSAVGYEFESCQTRQDAIGPYNRRDVVAAMIRTHAMWAEMSRLLGRNRSRVREFVYRNSDMKVIYDEIKEMLLDDLEHGIVCSALAGDNTDRRFLLQTLGKNRGYSTRQEVTGEGGGPVLTSTIDVTKLTTSELKALRRAAVTTEST